MPVGGAATLTFRPGCETCVVAHCCCLRPSAVVTVAQVVTDPRRVGFKTTRLGSVTTCATVTTAEGLKQQQCATTQVSQPGLKVSVAAPPTGIVGKPLT